MSEWQPVQHLAIGGGDLWAVNPEGLHRTSVEGTDDWVKIEGLTEKGGKHPFRALKMDLDGNLWIGGKRFLATIGGGTATRFTTIEKIVGTITLLEASPEGTVWAGGGSRIAVHEGESWQIMDLAFVAGDTAVVGETLWVEAGSQGAASIEGESVMEFADPLAEGDDSHPVSVASVGDEPCVLWGGDSAHLSFLRNDAWQVYAVPAAAGEAIRILDGGAEALLETTRGLFLLTSRPEAGMIPLEALHEPIPAKAFSYLAELEQPDEDADPPTKPPKRDDPQPLPATKGPGGELPGRGLIHVKTELWSPVTAVAGDGEHVVVGTAGMGTYVLRQEVVVSRIASYGVRPRTPVSKMPLSNGEFYYVLENDPRAGVVSKGTFSAELITADEHAQLLAFDVRAGQGFAMSLVRELETVQFFAIKQDGSFEKILDRTIDLAGGISDIGGFLAHTDGSFWFTPISAAEGLEMGVAVAYEDEEEIIYHGSVPQPPDRAVTIPNGVSSIELMQNGDIWLGGMEGAVRLDPDLAPTVYREPEGLVGDIVADIAVDGDDLVWVLTADGLGWFEDGRWHFPDASPYRGTVVSCIGVTGDGSLLIADEEAVRRKEGDDWNLVIALEDLPGRNVLDVTDGAHGRLWIVTDKAIAIGPPEE
ncbi:MAG: hypothetical protein JRG91_02885 [Deltaproteobacteria bacterium]|nr:hypothetical protein [Deltaproteobacteria bacterium]